MSFVTLLTIVLLCIIFSAIFSAAETAITAISPGKMKTLQEDKVPNAEKVIKLRADSDKFLSTILIANNLVNILASSLAAAYLTSTFGEEAVFLSTALMTLLLIVFAELLPKTLALKNAENLSLKLANIIYFLVFILSPISIVIRYLVNAISKILGVKNGKINISAFEELRGTLKFHRDLGNVNKHDLHMLEGLLDLEEMTIKQVMIHRKYIHSINIDQPISEIISNAFASGYAKIPLWKDNPENIVAILDVKLLLKQISFNPNHREIEIEKVSMKPWFVPQTTSLKKQLASFRERFQYFAIVVDEYGGFKGVVTLRDIVEEIVGILEEDEKAEATLTLMEDGSYLVSADYMVRDFVKISDFDFDDETSTTIGGIVINITNSIPDKGAEITYHDYKFKIMDKNNNKLSKILISKLNTKSSA